MSILEAMAQQVRLTRTTRAVLEVLLDGYGEELWGLRICGLTNLPSGTVYPILVKLEDLGWIESCWEGDQSSSSRTTGPRRRFYRLTSAGLQQTQDALAAANSGWTLSRLIPGTAGGGHS